MLIATSLCTMLRLANCCRTGSARMWKNWVCCGIYLSLSVACLQHIKSRLNGLKGGAVVSGCWHCEKALCPSSRMVGPDLIWHLFDCVICCGCSSLSTVYTVDCRRRLQTVDSTVLQMDHYEWKAVMNLLWHQEDRALQDALGHHWLPWDRWHR